MVQYPYVPIQLNSRLDLINPGLTLSYIIYLKNSSKGFRKWETTVAVISVTGALNTGYIWLLPN